MSVSPDPSVGTTSNIHVVNATTNGTHSRQHSASGVEPDSARSELARTPSVGDLARTSSLTELARTPSHPDLARTPSHPDLARTPSSHDLRRTPSHPDLRPRSGTDTRPGHGHRTSTDMTRTLSDIETFRPSQTPNQTPRPPLSRAPSSSSRTVAASPNDRDRDRRNSSSTSDGRALSGVLGDVRAPQTPSAGAPIGGVVVSPSGRTRDGASLMRERSGSQGQVPPKERDGFVNEGPASYRARHGEVPGPAPGSAYSPRGSISGGPRPSQTSPTPAPRSPVVPLQPHPDRQAPPNQPPPDRQAPPMPNHQPPISNHQPPHAPANHHPPTQPRRDSLQADPRNSRNGPTGPGSIQVTTAGSPRRGSFNDPRPPRAPAPLPPRPSQPSGRYGGEGHYETGRDLVLGRPHGHMRPEFGPPWMGNGRPPPTGLRYDIPPRRDSMNERERWDRDERERWDRDERDRWDRDERDRRDSMLDRRDPMLVDRDRRDPIFVERDRRDPMLIERDRRDSIMNDRERDRRDSMMSERRNSVNGVRAPPATWPPTAPPRPGGQPVRAGPVELRPEVLVSGSSVRKGGSPVGGRSRAGSRSNSPRGGYLRAESGSVRSSPMDMDSS